MIFRKIAKTIQRGKKSLPTNNAVTSGYLHAKESSWTQFTPHMKINSKWIIPKRKSLNYKTYVENTGVSLQYLRLGSGFLNMTLKQK